VKRVWGLCSERIGCDVVGGDRAPHDTWATRAVLWFGRRGDALAGLGRLRETRNGLAGVGFGRMRKGIAPCKGWIDIRIGVRLSFAHT